MRREYDFSKAKRGQVVTAPKGKTRITIRLDDEVVNWLRQQVDRAGGGNYQSAINDALRQHIRWVREPPETTLRRVNAKNSATPADMVVELIGCGSTDISSIAVQYCIPPATTVCSYSFGKTMPFCP